MYNRGLGLLTGSDPGWENVLRLVLSIIVIPALVLLVLICLISPFLFNFQVCFEFF